MKRFIIEFIMAWVLIIYSADLLYLYYIGAWHDPIKAIELTEIALLYFFIVLGVSYIIWRVRKEFIGG